MLEARGPLGTAYFLDEGLVTILASGRDGAAAEGGLVGPGGLVGHAIVLGAAESQSAAVALTRVRGLALDAEVLERAATLCPSLRNALLGYTLMRFEQTERLCVCAARHSTEQRVARWLLQAANLIGGPAVEITHGRLAELLGVRRASVTVALHLLEGDQAVRCRRSQIEIRNVTRLEGRSCGCHELALRSQVRTRRPPPYTASSSATSSCTTSSTESPRD
jgi:CRP-like cAMP-binding protein